MSESPAEISEFNTNKRIADLLSEISTYYGIERAAIQQKIFVNPNEKQKALNDAYNRERTFRNASIAISNYPIEILSGAQAESNIRGIGKSTKEEIDEFLQLGTSQRLIRLRTEYSEYTTTVNLFRSIYGIGPMTALKFYNKGYRTLKDIWESGELNRAQELGVLWREHIPRLIPRDEMNIIQQRVIQLLPPNIIWEIVGSYRRGELQSGDVDILVKNLPDRRISLKEILYYLRSIIAADLTEEGGSKYMGIIRLSEKFWGRRLDVRLIDAPFWPYTLMHFTGSQRFNVLMRQRAIDLGLTLNEYGLYPANTSKEMLRQISLYPANSEEDIFHYLGVQYLAPEHRLRNLVSLPLLEL